MPDTIEYSTEEKQRMLEAIARQSPALFDEEVGILKATQLFDFFNKLIGVRAYNRGIEDAHSYLQMKLGDMEIDLLKRMEHA